MILDGSLQVDAAEQGPEKPRRALVKVTLPAHIAFLARKVESSLPSGAVRVTDGVGPRTLRVRCESFKQLNELLAPERVSVRLQHPIERACLAYRPAHSDEDAENMLRASLPEALIAALFPFQREGVLFALRHDARVLIADEMGLGKTVQAIATALCFADEWPMLVLCPASLCANWKTELVRWMECAGMANSSARVHVIRSGKDRLQAEGEVGAFGVSIVSYDLATKLAEPLGKLRFGVCVCDESHTLKSPTAARTEASPPRDTGEARHLPLWHARALAAH